MSAPAGDDRETGAPRYTPHDFAYHPVHLHQAEEGGELAGVIAWHAENRGGPLVVAEIIAQSCAVGYGGHYGEVLEDHGEGEVMSELARIVSPYYQVPVLEAYRMLEHVRDEYTRRLSAARDMIVTQWKSEGWVVDVSPQSADNCPTCGRAITDADPEGCEAPDGQRWCVGHALEVLARLRYATLEARGELG